MPEKEKLRIDKYLWSIRLFKTRSQAADACDKGKVKLNGDNVKAAKPVNIGDEYEVKTEAKRWIIKVTGLLEKRVQYSEAIKYYIDLTPAEELDRLLCKKLVIGFDVLRIKCQDMKRLWLCWGGRHGHDGDQDRQGSTDHRPAAQRRELRTSVVYAWLPKSSG